MKPKKRQPHARLTNPGVAWAVMVASEHMKATVATIGETRPPSFEISNVEVALALLACAVMSDEGHDPKTWFTDILDSHAHRRLAEILETESHPSELPPLCMVRSEGGALQ